MTISATYVAGSNGDGEPRRVCTPKPRPTVSHQVSATAPAGHTAPVSAGRPAIKRKGWSDSKTNAKRVKADKVCQTTPCFVDVKMYWFLMSKCLALSF